MSEGISRVQLLRGDIRGARIPVRPPWALPEQQFTDICTRCNDCMRACPENILVKGQGGFPQVDFNRGECTFCRQCLPVCKTGALSGQQDPPWSLIAQINEDCLAHKGVTCMICADQCESRAIRFRPRVGGAALPELDESLCNGCGACFKPCPAKAIRPVYPHSINTNLQQQSMEAQQ